MKNKTLEMSSESNCVVTDDLCVCRVECNGIIGDDMGQDVCVGRILIGIVFLLAVILAVALYECLERREPNNDEVKAQSTSTAPTEKDSAQPVSRDTFLQALSRMEAREPMVFDSDLVYGME